MHIYHYVNALFRNERRTIILSFVPTKEFMQSMDAQMAFVGWRRQTEDDE